MPMPWEMASRGSRMSTSCRRADRCRVGAIEAVEDVHQRRLAGAVAAEQAVDLAAADREVDAVQGHDRTEVLRIPSMERRGREESGATPRRVSRPSRSSLAVSLDRGEVLLDGDLAGLDVGDRLLDLRDDRGVDVLRRLDRDAGVEAERVVAAAVVPALIFVSMSFERLGEVVDRGRGVVLGVELRLVRVLRGDETSSGLPLMAWKAPTMPRLSEPTMTSLPWPTSCEVICCALVGSLKSPVQTGVTVADGAGVLERLVDGVDLGVGERQLQAADVADLARLRLGGREHAERVEGRVEVAVEDPEVGHRLLGLVVELADERDVGVLLGELGSSPRSTGCRGSR